MVHLGKRLYHIIKMETWHGLAFGLLSQVANSSYKTNITRQRPQPKFANTLASFFLQIQEGRDLADLIYHLIKVKEYINAWSVSHSVVSNSFQPHGL